MLPKRRRIYSTEHKTRSSSKQERKKKGVGRKKHVGKEMLIACKETV